MTLKILTLKNRSPLWAFWTMLTAGFAVFSMFFGAGNLVIPLLMGKAAGSHHSVAMLGLLISGVLVPSMGLFAVFKANGRVDHFFSKLGKRSMFFFPFLMLALLGPFGVVPRCITVAHASFETGFGDFSLALFSGAFCCVIYLILQNQKRFIEIIGGLLTPILLVSLGLIIFAAITTSPSEFAGEELQSTGSIFAYSLIEGYQTMDLMAGFFFAATIISQISEKSKDKGYTPQSITSFTITSLIIGGVILSFVYACLIYLGAKYGQILEGQSPEKYISIIAHSVLGKNAGLIVSLAVIMACLTTAVALTKICAEFAREKMKLPLSLLICLGITFLTSLLEFKGIIAILYPILQVFYPGIIVFTTLSLFLPNLKERWTRFFVFATIGVCGIYSLVFMILS